MSKNNSEDSKAMVFEMPRTDVDLSDPQEGVNFTEENLDLQIKNLFDELMRHQRAYREAVSKSNFSHKLKKLGKKDGLGRSPELDTEYTTNDNQMQAVEQ